MKCKVDGCKKNIKPRDTYCSMHRARMTRTGRLDKKSPYERLMEKVKKDDCWWFCGTTDKKGYGRIRAYGKKILAHRFFWEHVNGKIPPGLLVLHSCDNPACINPEHLFLGTHKDNAQDMAQKKRGWLQRAKAQKLQFRIRNGELPEGYKPITCPECGEETD